MGFFGNTLNKSDKVQIERGNKVTTCYHPFLSLTGEDPYFVSDLERPSVFPQYSVMYDSQDVRNNVMGFCNNLHPHQTLWGQSQPPQDIDWTSSSKSRTARCN